MSHIVKAQTEITDLRIIKLTCGRLGIGYTERITVEFYDSRATGTAVYLKNWRYPIVIDQQTGQVSYDNFGGSWGNIRKLEEFKQTYVEVALEELLSLSGYHIAEATTNARGERILQIVEIGGVA